MYKELRIPGMYMQEGTNHRFLQLTYLFLVILSFDCSVLLSHRYCSHLQVIACPNKRTSLLKKSNVELYEEEKHRKTSSYDANSR